MDSLLTILKIIAAIIGIPVATGKLIQLSVKASGYLKAKRLASTLARAESAPQYLHQDVRNAVIGYVRPDCSTTDPANEDDINSFADVRENVFNVIDKSVLASPNRHYHLILADTGMGKTSFCLNYYEHYIRTKKDQNIVLISLADTTADERIEKVSHKSTKVVLLDALDEDAQAIRDGRDRLYDILRKCADFKSVIITCRSQFFPNDLSIPTETGVSILAPRRAGQNSTYKLTRLYLSPFTGKQINKFLNMHFPYWYVFNLNKRRRANRLIANVREISVRPMLLDLVPQLVRDNNDAKELFDLYKFMVEKWLDREAQWISPEKLIKVSKRLAEYIHKKHVGGLGDRVSRSELIDVANTISANDADWDHLTTRSLLNRDSKGDFKFAHRSIMEFLFVWSAIDGSDNCLDVKWTEFMKEIFVSWGYTEEGAAGLVQAERILSADLRATGLLPLSDAPTPPTSAPDFESAATRRAVTRKNRRSATALWRVNSIQIREQQFSTFVFDLEFNLKWLLTDRAALQEAGMGATYLKTIAQEQQSFLNDATYRSPSYAEFVTLIEGLEAIGRAELLPDNVLYLLGDKLGDRRHLLASLNRRGTAIISTDLVLRDKERNISFTERKSFVYEAGIFIDPAGLQRLQVAPLRVAVEGFDW